MAAMPAPKSGSEGRRPEYYEHRHHGAGR